MDQIGHQLGFADEVLDELPLVGIVLADHLDGDALDEFARAELLGLIDNPHAALDDQAHDLVAELVLDCEQDHAAMLLEREVKSSPSFGPRLLSRNKSFSTCRTGLEGFNSGQV